MKSINNFRRNPSERCESGVAAAAAAVQLAGGGVRPAHHLRQRADRRQASARGA